MPAAFISKSLVDSLLPNHHDLFVWDHGAKSIKGFGLKVTPTGTKTYILQYRVIGRRTPKRYTIGRHGSLAPDQARAIAKQLSARIAAGADPAEDRRRQKSETTSLAFTAYSEKFISEYLCSNWRRVDDASALIRRYAQPALGDRSISVISKSDIHATLDRTRGKTATKRNLFAVLRKLFAWAVERGDLSISPVSGLTAPPAVKARDRVLNEFELRLVWLAAQKLPPPFTAFFQALVLTGQRRQEVAGLKWQELNRAERIWVLPRERSKNGISHIVPLSSTMVEIIDSITTEGNSWPTDGFVFTTTGRSPISGFSKAKSALDLHMHELAGENAGPIEPWRTHDLRRSVATGLQRLGVRLEVTERILNHRSGTHAGIVGVYQRYDFADEKRSALSSWDSHLQQIVSGTNKNNVVPLPFADRA